MPANLTAQWTTHSDPTGSLWSLALPNSMRGGFVIPREERPHQEMSVFSGELALGKSARVVVTCHHNPKRKPIELARWHASFFPPPTPLIERVKVTGAVRAFRLHGNIPIDDGLSPSGIERHTITVARLRKFQILLSITTDAYCDADREIEQVVDSLQLG
ncbi:MAG: hypothetical protein R3E02_06245 [Blastomonas sp.]